MLRLFDTEDFKLYLKKLELKGFKSFADNTEIYLNPGINVIVGPNGCGKSNLVDAIRWVLGEANVRNLRGLKGEDVIFNGTDKSRALGMASVEMTLDNTDNILPVEYNEVTVARKIFRSGESEFSLNKSRVRMKDIGQLFMGTGLGKRGYSIISQGELEQVLNGQPIDRRLILEEASGTIKYRQQREEVKKSIANTKQDLLRISDIFSELNIQQQDLAIKAEKAERYRKLTTEYKRLELELLSFEISKLLKDYNNKVANLGKLKVSLSQNKTSELANLTICQNNENILEKLKLEISNLKEELYNLENKKNNLNGDIRLSQERISNYNSRLKTAELDEEKYAEMLANISEEVTARQEDYQAQNLLYQNKQAEMVVFSKYLEELQKELALLKNQFELDKTNIFTHIEDESKIKNITNEKEALLSRLREKQARLTIKKEELATNIKNNRDTYTKLEQDIRDLTIETQGISKMLTNLLKNKDDYLLTLQKEEKLNIELENELRSVNNRLINIRDSEEKLVGYSNAVKQALSLQNKMPNILGVIGELIRVPEGLEVAIETAAGRGLENIVVKTSVDAKKVIEYLKATKAGRVTLLPLDMLKVSNVTNIAINQIKQEKGVLGIASELIEYDPKFAKPINYIFSRTLIAEDIDTSIRLFKKYNLPFRIVTLEGEVLNNSGALTGGSSKSNPTYSPLQRKSAERKLTQQKLELQDKLQFNLTNMTNIKTKLTEVEQEVNIVKSSHTEKDFQLQLITNQADLLKQELAQVVTERTNILYEIENINENITSLSQDILELKNDLTKMEKKSTAYSNKLENMRLSIDKKQKDYEVGQARLTSQQEFLAAKEQDLINIKRNMEQFLKVKNSYFESRQNAITTSSKLKENITLETEKILLLTEDSQVYQEKLAIINETISLKQVEEDKYIEEINQVKKILNPIKENIIKLEASIHNEELNIARLETQLSNLKEKWRDMASYDLPTNIEVNYTSSEIRNFKANLTRINQELLLIGTVDEGAIEEYKLITERVNFLAHQLNDIKVGKESLEKLLVETEKIMLKQFRQFFVLANESFKQTFQEIFAGGEANLVLDDSTELLEAGVNLEVKLPGKKTQALSLLSGGERALTCIAFIFALLRLRPAPFCLLDEIDAALDETNLVRFSNFLNNMAKNMQFIIITHRQTTMACAKNIYGITMPEKGISSVLTLSLAEAENLAG